MNRITLRSSQTCGIDPAISRQWNDQRKSEVCLKLLGVLKLDDLITHRIKYDNIADAYEMIDKNPDQSIQVILEY